MSRSTCSNSKPRVSIAPSARAQNMNASSGSGLWPKRMSMPGASYLHWPREGAAHRVDPALSARDLQASKRGGEGIGVFAREAAQRVEAVCERDGEKARSARP